MKIINLKTNYRLNNKQLLYSFRVRHQNPSKSVHVHHDFASPKQETANQLIKNSNIYPILSNICIVGYILSTLAYCLQGFSYFISKNICSIPGFSNCISKIIYYTPRFSYCISKIIYCTPGFSYCLSKIIYCIPGFSYCTSKIVYCTSKIVYCTPGFSYCTSKIVYCISSFANITRISPISLSYFFSHYVFFLSHNILIEYML